MINEINLRLSPTHKQQIKEMHKNAYDLQKQNRMRWANLIMKQSELSSRRHKLSQDQLKYAKFNEENQNKQMLLEKYKKEVDDYKTQISLVQNQILIENKNYQSINEKMSNIQITNINPLKKSVSKRKKKVMKIMDSINTSKKQLKQINNQKRQFKQAIKIKQKLISDYDDRLQKANIILQQPIDDLRIQEITVKKLENYILQISNEASLNENDDSSTNEEETLINKIEVENLNKKKRIEKLKSNLQHLKSSSFNQSASISRTSSPKKSLTKTSIEYDKDRLDQFDSVIDSLKERQKMIDEVEEMTTRYQIAWISDQKQIEESWMLKMNDMQELQNRIDEIEQLIIDIDEISDEIVQLKENQMILDEEQSEFQKSQSKLQIKIAGIGLEHNTMKEKINDWLEKKEFVDKQKEKLNQKKKSVQKLDDEVHQLEEKYKEYREYVKSLESQVNETKQAFNLNKSQNNIELRNPIKFSDSIQNKLNKNPRTPMPKKPLKSTSNIENIDSNIEAEYAIKTIQKLINNSNQSIDMISNDDSQRSEIEINFSDDNDFNDESNQPIINMHAISTLKMSQKQKLASNHHDDSLSNRFDSLQKTNSPSQNRNFSSNNFSDKLESSSNVQNSVNKAGSQSNKFISLAKANSPFQRENSDSNKNDSSVHQMNTSQRMNSPAQSKTSSLNKVNSPSKEFDSTPKVVTVHSVFNNSNQIESTNYSTVLNNKQNSTFHNSVINQSSFDKRTQSTSLHFNDFSDSIENKTAVNTVSQKSALTSSASAKNTNSHFQTMNQLILDKDDQSNLGNEQESNSKEKLHSDNYNVEAHSKEGDTFTDDENQFNFGDSQFQVEEEEEPMNSDYSNHINYNEDNQINSGVEDQLNSEEYNQMNSDDDNQFNFEEEEEQTDETSNYETTVNHYFRLNTNQTNQDLYSMGFPTPEHFDDSSMTNKNETTVTNTIDNSVENYQTEYKSFGSNQTTPIKQPVRSISKTTEDLQTPNRTNRYSHSISFENDDSDQEFNLLIEEAKNAIKLPLLQSKYLQS